MLQTIKTMYFPFTTISESTVGMLRTCFSTCSIYALPDKQIHAYLKHGLEDNWLDIRLPECLDREKIQTVIFDFQSWSELHEEGIVSYLKSQRDRAPFFDDSAISQVVKEIKGTYQEISGGKPSAPDKEDDLMMDALFLYAAASFDMQTDEVSTNMKHFKHLEQNFISGLRDEADSTFLNIASAYVPRDEDTGSYMTSERIRSWSRLLCCDSQIPDLYVTSSPAVLNHILDNTADAIRVIEWGPMSKASGEIEKSEDISADQMDWQRNLNSAVEALLNTSSLKSVDHADIGSPDTVSMDQENDPMYFLDIYLIPNRKPRDFFASISGNSRMPNDKQTNFKQPENTLIGWIHKALPS